MSVARIARGSGATVNRSGRLLPAHQPVSAKKEISDKLIEENLRNLDKIAKMRNKTGDLAGFAAIEDRYHFRPVQPLSSCCRLGTKRTTVVNDNYRVETFLASYAPDDNLRGHFEFGLKYDDLNLEWLSRLFSQRPSGWIVDWLRDTPTSSYARKTAFLCEWLSGKPLAIEDTKVTGYELALDRWGWRGDGVRSCFAASSQVALPIRSPGSSQ